MRCFTAIDCPQKIREELVKIQQEIEGFGPMKLVEPENIHLTVKFLGDVEEVDAVKDKLGEIKKDKFKVNVSGVGVFPHPGYVKVVWTGVAEGKEDIENLHEDIQSRLKPLGFERDNRFHPHYTLARVKGRPDKDALKEYLQENENTVYGEYQVSEFKLMKSTLTRQGPVYECLKRYPFEDEP